MIVDRLLRIKPSAISAFTPGSLQSRVLGVSQLREVVTSNFTPILTAFISVAFNFFYLFYFSWLLALLVLAAGVVLSVSTLYAASKRVSQFKMMTELDGVMLASTNETISGIQEVRSFDATDDFFKKYVSIIRPMIRAIFNATRLNDRVDVLSSSTTYILYLFLFPMAYTLAMQGDTLSTGQIIAFLTCTQTFLSNFQSAIDKTITATVQVSTYWQRALEVLDLSTEEVFPNTTPKRFNGSLDVSNLSYSFDNSRSSTVSNKKRMILQDLNFSCKPASSTLIIGSPGSGKSTLLSILSLIIEDYSGSIVVSDVPLNSITPRIYRAHISNVPQQLLFQQGSIKTNLTSGLSIAEDSIQSLLSQFGLDDYINKLPMKLGTVITPTAQSIPDLIKKKLLLVRAALRRSKYIFIDDTLTGLDPDDCKSILNYFKTNGATVICTTTDSSLSSYFDSLVNLDT
jgi:ABC-type bacteriocin/lantibiotic exporter with double-glycine peptidase domain